MPVFNNSPTNGYVGVPYSFTWEIEPAVTIQLRGELPSGLTLSNNVISGTPETAGEHYLIAYAATDEIVTQEFVITIRQRIFRGCYLQE